jgi:plastocyanin
MRNVLIATLLCVLAAACGSTATPSGTSTPASPGASATPSAQAQANVKKVDPRKDGLDVGFGEFAITLEAKAIKPGPVTLVIHNGGKLVHGFEMKAHGGGSNSGHGGGGDGFKIEAPTFGPNDTIRIKANLPVGTYEIECYVANHDALGMRTTLFVREDAPLISPQTAAPGEVLIQGFAFAPGATTVQTGTTVVWKNTDPTEHTVTAKDGSFSSDPLPSGGGYRVTFDQAGSFAYYCAIHPTTMNGTIQVTG